MTRVYLYPRPGTTEPQVWREGDSTWMVTAVRSEPSVDEVKRLADMLTEDERAVIHAAYGASTLADILALVPGMTCHLCVVPLSLRDPSLPWPDCSTLHATG